MKNINDLIDEHPNDYIIGFTAKYKHIQWSFSCSKTDYEGHKTTSYADFPHYHMQMQLDGQSFIRYSDFHIPFHGDDIFDIELYTKHKDTIRHDYGHGSGMQALFESTKGLECILDTSHPVENEENAAFKINTLVMAKEGETIDGNLIADAIKEAKNKNKTVSSILRDKLKNTNASISIDISPGDGVPEPQIRNGRNKKK
ncbi:MAG: hypothetical protein EHM79_18520 [Geobacter sp.]|nr:MAG: hypothetical protein EHM79_18520 [Geobacter sp.]